MGRRKFFVVAGLVVGLFAGLGVYTSAQETPANGFSLQVTPSPLVATIEPGQKNSLELRIRNRNSEAEELKIEHRAFTVDNETGDVQLSDGPAGEVKDFVSFEKDVFTIEAGEWYTQKVNIDTPPDAGFSYSFAIFISRKDKPEPIPGTSAVEGSVAIFTLLNTNRPDAERKLDLASFISTQRSYEYLPAEFEVKIENSGNTIVAPRGNIFIDRSADEQEPLAALELNPGDGYIIPGTVRTLQTEWNDGFPGRNENGDLVWDWSKLNQLRIGRYTAKAVLIYDDGQRDVPVEAVLTFWVIPWKILLVFIAILLLLLVGLYTIFRKIQRSIRPKDKKPKPKKTET